jgi:hypothetical protein
VWFNLIKLVSFFAEKAVDVEASHFRDREKLGHQTRQLNLKCQKKISPSSNLPDAWSKVQNIITAFLRFESRARQGPLITSSLSISLFNSRGKNVPVHLAYHTQSHDLC